MILRSRLALLGAGALLTTTILVVAPATARSDTHSQPTTTPAPAQRGPIATKASAGLIVRHVRRTVIAGGRVVVTGTLEAPGAGRRVSLQLRRGRRWVTIARTRTGARGGYRLRWRATRPGTLTLRVTFPGSRDLLPAQRAAGRANVYRLAFASWYGPGLYGGHLACGGTLTAGTLGVANKTLPCGTRLTLHYRGRTVRVRVIDRGPYVAGREFDLTAATKARLGFGSTGYVLSTA